MSGDVAVQLRKEHRHNGIMRLAGDFIMVPPAVADWLESQRIAKRVKAAQAGGVKIAGNGAAHRPIGVKKPCCGGRW